MASRNLHARDTLVSHYMGSHVRTIAERLAGGLPAHVNIEELMQEGYWGLMEALGRFDPSVGVRFETFSSRRISGAMKDWLRKQDHVPRLMRKRARIIMTEIERFRVAHGRTPDREELRDAMDIEPEEFDRIMAEAPPPVLVTMGAVSAGGEDDPVAVPDPRGSSPLAGVQRRDLQRWITRDLDEVDRMIVVLYYYESLTMREIGVAIGCSESRISQRLDSIHLRLRARLDVSAEGLELLVSA